jgi:DNA-binding FadR family transcriptional regulator
MKSASIKPRTAGKPVRGAAAARKAAAGTGSPRQPKSASVIDVLGLKIIRGELSPGDLLPIEAELSRTLGISRPSLREGLSALAQKGLLEGRTRRGTTINDKKHWNVLDQDVLRWIANSPPDPAFFMDLLDVRAIFEPAAARIAAARASPQQILAIEKAFKSMAAALPDDVDACCQHDLAFHELIISATGNPLLIRFAGAIRTALLAAFRISSNARKSYEDSLAEHWAVAVAIRRRAPDEAEQAMQNLLVGSARDLAPAYEHLPRGKSPAKSGKAVGGKPRRRVKTAGSTS